MYQRLWKNMDHVLLAAVGVLLVFSLITIGSATLEYSDPGYLQLKSLSFFWRLTKLDFTYVVKQLVWIVLGLGAFGLLISVDYEVLIKHSRLLYAINLLLLLLVIFLGHTALGAQRWIAIGPFQFQPSEFSKLILIITLARFLAEREGRLSKFRELIPCFAFVGLPTLLVLKQPDLGTSLVFVAIMFGMLFMAGARPSVLVTIIGLGLAAGVALYFTHHYVHQPDVLLEERLAYVNKALEGNAYYVNTDENIVREMRSLHLSTDRKADLLKFRQVLEERHRIWHARHEKFHKFTLKEYQMTRLTIFVDPESDLLGAGYHVWQSRIAIGSGGIQGKGLLGGTQTHFTFLPIRHTDFIFSVVGEEFGLLGGLLVLALFALLLYRGSRVVLVARDSYGVLLATGVVCMFAFHVLVNIGMTAGVMPVTGIPLPLFSYGGSNMLMNLAALGLLMNVYIRRKKLML
ncbi:MAG: rod shape-determining protein RodA [Desulfurispora sp.]|uniref:rod shape-determining protein RodA n=1 Tax=Desulfurispora sp. TaxID=3014275 RepID=UPI00404A4010